MVLYISIFTFLDIRREDEKSETDLNETGRDDVGFVEPRTDFRSYEHGNEHFGCVKGNGLTDWLLETDCG
jgi:hypothetical protein